MRCQFCTEECDVLAEDQMHAVRDEDGATFLYLQMMWKSALGALADNYFATCKALRISPKARCCKNCMKRKINEFYEACNIYPEEGR